MESLWYISDCAAITQTGTGEEGLQLCYQHHHHCGALIHEMMLLIDHVVVYGCGLVNGLIFTNFTPVAVPNLTYIHCVREKLSDIQSVDSNTKSLRLGVITCMFEIMLHFYISECRC